VQKGHLRSLDVTGDVITTPSLSMLHAIAQSTLRDDVFREDTTMIDFESFIAGLAGHEAGCFALTGTMANQLALRTLLTQAPHALLCASTAHILNFEAGGPALLGGTMVQPVVPLNGKFLTLADIRAHAVLDDDDVHKCPTRAISLENTAGGSIVPLSEMQLIRQWTEENDIAIHLDGARLWEAVAAGAGTVAQYCSLADTVTLDFSKNLGAPMGAMVVSSRHIINRMRRIRKAIGGGVRQGGMLAAAARVAVEQQSDKLIRSHEMAKRVESMWRSRQGRVLRSTETNICWLDLRAAGISREDFNNAGKQQGIRLDGERVVLHHQISEEALRQISLVFDYVLPTAKL